jgi:hypothetical protein
MLTQHRVDFSFASLYSFLFLRLKELLRSLYVEGGYFLLGGDSRRSLYTYLFAR